VTGRLTGKVALVVGGATGIGAASARRLAAEGATVAIGDRNVDGARATAAGIGADGGVAEAFEVDIAQDASVAAMVAAVVERFGGLDLLHCNAADTSAPAVQGDGDVVTIDLELWDHILRVNLTGYLLACRHAIPPMLERGGGAIVCTASDGAFMGMPAIVAYNTSKAGVNVLVRHVAARWGKESIRANAVSPGMVLTDAASSFIPAEVQQAVLDANFSTRLGEPEDIAAAVAYLLSDDAAWVNGQVLSVNGGALVR
jgi:NAD(P)-dependent dehydrogenase (short-subunit alcohol dehydrogenase family)